VGLKESQAKRGGRGRSKLFSKTKGDRRLTVLAFEGLTVRCREFTIFKAVKGFLIDGSTSWVPWVRERGPNIRARMIKANLS